MVVMMMTMMRLGMQAFPMLWRTPVLGRRPCEMGWKEWRGLSSQGPWNHGQGTGCGEEKEKEKEKGEKEKAAGAAPSFFRRELPEGLIEFGSEEGRQVFREALATEHMNGYFSVAAQFRTQEEPAYCGLGTLVTVLNALRVDPQRPWKGVWRHYSEELFDCCADLDRVKREGTLFDQLACLARCNGLAVDVSYGSRSSEQAFRAAVASATASSDSILMVSYCRQAMRQTGSGHISPIGGYHPQRDLVLIMDVARYKYPPHWAPLPLLFDATRRLDPASGLSRGFVLCRRRDSPLSNSSSSSSNASSNASSNSSSNSSSSNSSSSTIPTILPQSLPSSVLTLALHDVWKALWRPLLARAPDTMASFLTAVCDILLSPDRHLLAPLAVAVLGPDSHSSSPSLHSLLSSSEAGALVAHHTQHGPSQQGLALLLLALACQPHLATPFLLPHAKLPLVALWDHLCENPANEPLLLVVKLLAHLLTETEQPCLCREANH